MNIQFKIQRSRNRGNMLLREKVEWDNRLAQYASDIIFAMQVEIETPKWDRGGEAMRWSGTTYYVSEAVDDIVDSGELRDSFFINVVENRTGTSYEIGSSKKDVNAIRFGYASKRSKLSRAKDTSKFESRWIEGRDFVRSALQLYPPRLMGAGDIRGLRGASKNDARFDSNNNMIEMGSTGLRPSSFVASTAPTDINIYQDDIF